MYQKLVKLIGEGLKKEVPATGLGVFRILFGLVILQEILFLGYFRRLIFDLVPYLDKDYPLIPFFLLLWGIAAVHLIIGRHTRIAALVNYLFWVLFAAFTPLSRDFDGGFDQLMISSGFFLIFLPSERALSIDNLRLKLKYSTTDFRYAPSRQVSVLAYFLPLAISLGLIYIDSAIHKLFAQHWRNGLGAWLPSSLPYYVSAIDMSWLLNSKWLQMSIGYAIIVFQFLFIFLLYFRPFRIPLMLFGATFHSGILLSLNIYPFGFGMLVHYALMVPFAWWRRLGESIRRKAPLLTVFYDRQCPLCTRTVIVVEHFDFLNAVEFKSFQDHARQYRALNSVSDEELLKDLYALDREGRLYRGVDTYIRIFLSMKYTAPIGWIMNLPGMHRLSERLYRRIADNRARLACDERCREVPKPPPGGEESPVAKFFMRYAKTPGELSLALAKLLVLVLVFQLNSTVHYGILYRIDPEMKTEGAFTLLKEVSNMVLIGTTGFLGITPHALYLHDHFEGYNHIFALTYRDGAGEEKWLPFVNEEGRMVAPNWGRVHSMWANIAVTPRIDRARLEKFIRKVTAFWGTKEGIDLSEMEFTLKMKEVEAPNQWVPDLRKTNLAQPWRDIGRVLWKEGRMEMEIPEIEMKTLLKK